MARFMVQWVRESEVVGCFFSSCQHSIPRKHLETLYAPSKLPQGYLLDEAQTQNHIILYQRTYCNSAGYELNFSQAIMAGLVMGLNSEAWKPNGSWCADARGSTTQTGTFKLWFGMMGNIATSSQGM